MILQNHCKLIHMNFVFPNLRHIKLDSFSYVKKLVFLSSSWVWFSFYCFSMILYFWLSLLDLLKNVTVTIFLFRWKCSWNIAIFIFSNIFHIFMPWLINDCLFERITFSNLWYRSVSHELTYSLFISLNLSIRYISWFNVLYDFLLMYWKFIIPTVCFLSIENNTMC